MPNTPNLMLRFHRLDHIPLERRVDSVKTSPLVPTPHQGDVLGMRPAQRHRCTGWRTTFEPLTCTVITVPKLFGDHPAVAGKAFHAFDKRHRITTGSQLVMAPFSGQNRPAPSHTRSVKRPSVLLFPVAIVIVATPAWSLRQVIFEHLIDHFD